VAHGHRGDEPRVMIESIFCYARDLRSYDVECADRPVHTVLVPTRGSRIPPTVDSVTVVGRESPHARSVPPPGCLRPRPQPCARRAAASYPRPSSITEFYREDGFLARKAAVSKSGMKYPLSTLNVN